MPAGWPPGRALLLVLAALVTPHQLERLTPGAFVRVPVEALVAVLLLLDGRP